MSVFKDHFLQDQESCIPTKKLDKTPRRPAWMNKGAPGQIQTVKGSLQRVETRTGQRVETRTGIQRGIQRDCLSRQGSGWERYNPDRIKSSQDINDNKINLL